MQVLKINLTASNASEKFVKSLKETGFAVLTHHPIDLELVGRVYKAFEDFFASEDKFTHLFDPMATGNNTGYFPMRSENAKGYDTKDLKEFYHYFPSEGISPVAPQEMSALFRDMESLAAKLLAWCEDVVPEEIRKTFDRPLPEMVKKSKTSLVRMLHYPPMQGDEQEGEIRAHAHGDINFITLLLAATAPGLEVQDLNGEWHKVSCDPGEIAVNVADMLEVVTQGFYKSTLHRVVNPEGEDVKKPRYSMPFFLHAHDDVMLTPDLSRKAYFDQRMREIGLSERNAA